MNRCSTVHARKVVVSSAMFTYTWPQKELDTLLTIRVAGPYHVLTFYKYTLRPATFHECLLGSIVFKFAFIYLHVPPKLITQAIYQINPDVHFKIYIKWFCKTLKLRSKFLSNFMWIFQRCLGTHLIHLQIKGLNQSKLDGIT